MMEDKEIPNPLDEAINFNELKDQSLVEEERLERKKRIDRYVEDIATYGRRG